MRFHSAVAIGSGGVGKVYRAFDPERGCEVALKLLQHRTPELALRLAREARAQALLKHPNVAAVYDSGVLPDGQPFIAMQLIDGRPIDEVATGLALRERVELLLPVLDAIHAAHRVGLVHRDLKPSNLLVEQTSTGLKPYVLDFGLVHDAAADDLTAAGEILGTPGYLAPEQVSPEAPVDARTDVFSLGVVLYQLACRRLPFPADSAAGYIAALLGREAPPPERFAPEVPPALSRIVQQCLERDPLRRYPSAQALKADLEAWLAGREPRARRYGRLQRGWRWLRASRLRLAVVLCLSALPVLLALRELHLTLRQQLLLAETQALTMTALDIEREMQLAMLWPDQDLAAHRRRMAPRIEALRAARTGASAELRQVAALPLARALEALGAEDELLAALRLAHAERPEDADLAGRLAQALSREELRRMASLSAIGDPERRRAERVRIESELAAPRHRLLAQAGAGSGEGALLARAQQAFEAGDGEQAEAILAAQPPGSTEALKVSARWRLLRALALADAGDAGALQKALDEAGRQYRRLAEVARSAPEAHTGLCVLAAAQLRLASRGGAEVPIPDFAPCDRAVASDPENADARRQRVLAQAALARRLLMLGQDPESSVAEVRAHTDPRDPVQAQALGEALLSQSEDLRRRGGDADAVLEEAISMLSTAAGHDPGHAGLWLTLAQARQLQALHGSGDDAAFAAVVDTLQRALALEETLSSRLRLAEALVWWGNARFHRLTDPGPELERAIALLSAEADSHPDDLRVLQRLAFALWTRGQYQAATGADAVATLEAAEAQYDRVLELDPARSASRFNRLSVQFTLARHLLQWGSPADAVLARASAGHPGLADVAEDDLKLQRAALALLKLRLRRGRGESVPDSEDLAVRDALRTAAALPRDRHAAAMQLADWWVQRPPRAGEAALLDPDVDLVETLGRDPEAPPLLALHRARLLARAAQSDLTRRDAAAGAIAGLEAGAPAFLAPYASEIAAFKHNPR